MQSVAGRKLGLCLNQGGCVQVEEDGGVIKVPARSGQRFPDAQNPD